MILNTHTKISPSVSVDGMSLNNPATIAPIPENMKCKNIVNVCATFSLVKKNDDTYVNGITANGNRMNNIHTFEY
jgi:hypothetical protein